ncbi:hypothetical protein O181_024996 [Austropuccinia psidii MF-1]|uniref:Uncharacterized protein n=1 Tax=Austropuccinia psidii MF-1 TaxID=1389203 RepID=A0A9Q3CHQ7_9BASI|nr:hypothetical protein [Austropuccinia psidii MF-1]
MPILKGDFSTHQSGNPWWQSEDNSRIPPTWPRRSWVGSFIQDFSKGNSQKVINHFNQLSRNQVFQYFLDNSIGPYRRQSINLYALGPIGPIHIPPWELNHTVQISRWTVLY